MENQQVLTTASMRADAEEMYGERMADIAPTVDRMNGGFSRDDGASVRKVWMGYSQYMAAQRGLILPRHTKVFEVR
jgi:hypothetical protein